MTDAVDSTPSRHPLRENEIRLVYFDGIDFGTLNFHTQIVKLTDVTGTYTALSYAWGIYHPSTAAVLNGSLVHITDTLHEALTLLWNTDPTLKIWVDYLSISQNDIDEKNRQVSLMGEIFAQSREVYIWLGEALRGPGDLLRLMKQFGEGEFSRSGARATHFFRSASILVIQLRDLTSRAWFARAWTWQEFELAPRKLLACGELIMQWDVFATAIRTLRLESSDHKVACGEYIMHWDERATAMPTLQRESDSHEDAAVEAFQQLRDLCNLGTEYFCLPTDLPPPKGALPKIGPEDGLWQLLRDSWRREATDPRDKIYSLLSPRMTGASWTEITPNYRLSVHKTYIRFVRSLINRTRDLRCLQTARGVGRSKLSLREERKGRSPWDRSAGSKFGPLTRLPLQTGHLSGFDVYVRLEGSDFLPSWSSDWRAEWAQDSSRDVPFASIDGLDWQHPRSGCPTLPQSINDFSTTLFVQGCIVGQLAFRSTVRRAHGLFAMTGALFREHELHFEQLPVCACSSDPSSSTRLEQIRPMDHLRYETVRRRSILGTSIPNTSMLKFFALLMLHEGSMCDSCPETDRDRIRKQLPLPSQGQYGLTLTDVFDYTRSDVATGDLLVLLDGLSCPALLRPSVNLKPIDGSKIWSGRSPLATDRREMAFSFVGTLPLAVDEDLWKNIPCVYGRMKLY